MVLIVLSAVPVFFLFKVIEFDLSSSFLFQEAKYILK